MERIQRSSSVFAIVVLAGHGWVAGSTADDVTRSPVEAIVASVEDPEVRSLLRDVLERNPEIEAMQARRLAADSRSVAARKLPDPRAELTAFVLPPETRVGPQRASARLVQRIPGGGKRALAGRTAELDGAALDAELEALRLRLVTDVRRLVAELGYVRAAHTILAAELDTLDQYEELARTRYAAGRGLQADAVRIQTEMTRIEARRSELAQRASALRAELNELRRRPGAPIVSSPTLSTIAPDALDWEALRTSAVTARPELRAIDARAERTETAAELASRGRSPDFSIGLTYAWIDPRDDAEVEDNGRDVLGINGGITIPLWGAAVDAEVEVATTERLAVEADKRAAVADIERQLEELRGRVHEIRRRLELFESVLPVQAEQALASARAAYTTGRADVLELLEAERVLLDARLATDRARADLVIALIELEGATAMPLDAGGRS